MDAGLRPHPAGAALSPICGATSATVCDKAFEALMEMRWQPAVRVSPPWHDDPVYIDALAESMQRKLAQLDFEPEMILVSLPRDPAGISPEGRSLSLPMREDMAVDARSVRPGRLSGSA